MGEDVGEGEGVALGEANVDRLGVGDGVPEGVPDGVCEGVCVGVREGDSGTSAGAQTASASDVQGESWIWFAAQTVQAVQGKRPDTLQCIYAQGVGAAEAVAEPDTLSVGALDDETEAVAEPDVDIVTDAEAVGEPEPDGDDVAEAETEVVTEPD